ncbi:MAG: hypothetical protein GF390_01340 [Candidatus Pacebacteria bacterium]|nr:hypothetical protein [Candidatus Paceibacterota bacterium]
MSKTTSQEQPATRVCQVKEARETELAPDFRRVGQAETVIKLAERRVVRVFAEVVAKQVGALTLKLGKRTREKMLSEERLEALEQRVANKAEQRLIKHQLTTEAVKLAAAATTNLWQAVANYPQQAEKQVQSLLSLSITGAKAWLNENLLSSFPADKKALFLANIMKKLARVKRNQQKVREGWEENRVKKPSQALLIIDNYSEALSELYGEIFVVWQHAQLENLDRLLNGPLQGKKEITRRSFLKRAFFGGILAALEIWGIGQTWRFINDQAVRAALKAVDARPESPEKKPDSEPMPITEIKAGFFEDNPLATEQILKSIFNSFNNILLLFFYFDPQDDDKLSFSDFTNEFLTRLQSHAQLQGLDLFFFMLASIISGENMGVPLQNSGKYPSSYPQDRRVSQIQVLARAVAGFLSVDSEFKKALTTFSGRKGAFLKLLDPSLPMNPHEVIRLLGPITYGMHDMESEITAEAVLEMPANQLQELERKHPQVVDAYRRLINKRSEVEEERGGLKDLAKEYVQDFGKSLDVFFVRADAGEEEAKQVQQQIAALSEIGISKHEIDSWQLTNPTMLWSCWLQMYNKSFISDNKEESVAFTNYRYRLRQLVLKSDAASYHFLFFQDQVLNPKFLSELKKRAKIDAERQLIDEIIVQKKKFEQKVEEFSIIETETYAAASAQDDNVEFQTQTGVAVVKHLLSKVEEKFGPLDPTSKHSLAWHLFCFAAIREVASLYSLTCGNVFARHSKIDPVYDHSHTLQLLQETVDLMLRHGLIVSKPEEDFVTFYYTLISAVSDNYTTELQRCKFGDDPSSEEAKEFKRDHLTPVFKHVQEKLKAHYYSGLDRAIGLGTLLFS